MLSMMYRYGQGDSFTKVFFRISVSNMADQHESKGNIEKISQLQYY